MSSSTIPKDFPLQVYKFLNFTPASGANPTSAELVSALNAVKSYIPAPGASLVQFGDASVGNRCIVLVSKVNANMGSGITLSGYSGIDYLHLRLVNGTWSLVT